MRTGTGVAVDAAAVARLDGVTKRFDDVVALDDVSIELAGGALTALVGEPGAGKSTLMHVLTGLKRPDSGTVDVAGVAVHALDHEARRAFLRDRVAALTMTSGRQTSVPRALDDNVALVVADDPTFALPPGPAAAVIDRLVALRAPTRTVLVATHSPAVVAAADAVYVVTAGKLEPV